MLPGSVCAIAADDKSTNIVWFVQTTGEFSFSENIIDDCGHTASPSQKFMLGYFLEQVHDQITTKKIQIDPQEEHDFLQREHSVSFCEHEWDKWTLYHL